MARFNSSSPFDYQKGGHFSTRENCHFTTRNLSHVSTRQGSFLNAPHYYITGFSGILPTTGEYWLMVITWTTKHSKPWFRHRRRGVGKVMSADSRCGIRWVAMSQACFVDFLASDKTQISWTGRRKCTMTSHSNSVWTHLRLLQVSAAFWATERVGKLWVEKVKSVASRTCWKDMSWESSERGIKGVLESYELRM